MASVSEDNEKIDTVTSDDISIREVTPPGGSSDGEGSERTTREKLKKTSIAGLQQHSKTAAGGVIGEHPLAESITIDQVEPPNENGGSRGRPSKKRSFEDLQNDEPTGPTENGFAGLPDPKRGYHKRMRSRDVGHADDSDEVGKLEEIASPVKEESDDDAHLSPGGRGVLVEANSQLDSNAQALRKAEQKILEEEDTTNEPTTGVATEPLAATGASLQPAPTDSPPSAPSQSQNKTSSTFSPNSGFANTSSASPFGAVNSPTQPSKDLPSSDKDPSATSNSAFASSGLSAFASSEKSPFGAASTAKTGGGFGGGSGGGFGGGISSGFGSTSASIDGASGFGSKSPSAFGGGRAFGSSGGFGSGLVPKPFGAGISSFGSTAGPASTFGRSKPFGAKDEDEENGEDEDEADEKPDQNGDTRQDSRFHQQEVETGEEEEEVFFQARARLYHFEREWKERGTGNIKINVRYEQRPLAESREDEQGEEQDPEAGDWSSEIRRARVVMRADGVHRVILNSPVFKGMKVGTNEGKEPIGKTMYLTGLEDGQPRIFQIKIGKEEVLKELYSKIEELKDELE